MRKLFIAMIAGGFLLLSGVVASARFDSGSANQAPQIRADGQGNQTGNANSQTTDKPATKPVTPATKPAVTTAANGQCGFDGEFEGEQNQDSAACNVQDGPNTQSGAADKTAASDTSEKGGNTEN